MEALDPYRFIHIGLCIRILMHSRGLAISFIADEARKLLNNLDGAGFQVSSVGTQDLKSFLDKLKTDVNQSRALTEEEVSSLSSIMLVVEKMVFAEAQTKRIYVLTEGRFSLDCLMNHPEKIFASGVFEKLPILARYDLKEGFLCIVFSRPTAAAFHILRATEATLKKYYFAKIKRGRDAKPMWGNMVTKLVARRDKNQALLEKLDFVRRTYRNPTDHPEATYTLDTAQDLLGLCIDLINSMADSLPNDETE